MSDTATLLFAWLAGTALGAMFFGGLWWTVRKGLSSARPALWFASSLLLRSGVVLAGLYWISGRRWERAAACLVGFVMARLVVIWLVGPSAGRDIRAVRGAHRAP